MPSQETTISVIEGEVPAFAAMEMERLYQHLFASARHHALYGDLDKVDTYVAMKNGIATAALLFRREGGQVRVLNEQMRIDAEEINRFARHVFASYDDVRFIVFHAIDAPAARLAGPNQKIRCTEDIVLTLPSSIDAYRATLGKSTRSYLSRYMNKLKRDFPDMRHDVAEAADINDADVRAVIGMNALRMNGKQRTSYIDADEMRCILQLCRERGQLSVIRIGGRPCAGAIILRAGKNSFLKVIAHDPAYDDYRLGTLCCYLSICECITRGAEEYHFLWGRYEYKYRLGGKQRDLDHLVVFRSHAHMLRHGGMVLQNALSGYSCETRGWLQTKARDSRRFGAVLRLAAHTLRSLRGRRNPPSARTQESLGDEGG